MNIKYVYPVVLLIVLSAWLGHSTTKPITITKHQKDNSKKVVSQIVNDPAIFGITRDKWSSGGKCNIEFINGETMGTKLHTIGKGKALKLVGWAVDIEKLRLPEKIVVRFKGDMENEFYALSDKGILREDVIEYYKLPNRLNNSGFELEINTKELIVGQYLLTLLVQFKDALYVCDNKRSIKIIFSE